VERPRWPSDMYHVRDYLIATRAFTFDLSTDPRDRRDLDLFDGILDALDAPGVVLGWHCCRDMERDNVARSAVHGFFVLCSLRSPNLTVHSGISSDVPLKQKPLGSPRTLSDRKYVSLILSDGDAIWNLINFQSSNWLKPERGSFPFSWEMQPLMVHLGPGIMSYYYETMTENDYFVAGPSGAGYTYPSLFRDPGWYLSFSKHYMDLCDIGSILIMNQDPGRYWREVDDPGFAERLRGEFREGVGFVRGYTEGIERSFLRDGPPYIHTHLYLGPDSDAYRALKLLGTGRSGGPLFIAVHVRETVDLGYLRDVVDRLEPEGYEFVRLDEFMLLIGSAIGMGYGEDEIFPGEDALRANFVEFGRRSWPDIYGRLDAWRRLPDLGREEALSELNRDFNRFTTDQTVDAVLYAAISSALGIAKAALNLKGIYVNGLEGSIRDFLGEYGHMPDAGVVGELYQAWLRWDLPGEMDFERSRSLLRRLISLADRLDGELKPLIGPR